MFTIEGKFMKQTTMGRALAAIVFSLALSGPALAGPVEDAQAMASEGKVLLDGAAKAKGDKKTEQVANGLRRYARAYLLITERKLQNDAPDLLKDITAHIEQGNVLPEVVALRQALLSKALTATIEGRLTEAYDQFASLRDLDPRDSTVEYALTVVGQRMPQ